MILTGRASPAIGLWRPIVFTAVDINSLEKEDLPQAQLVFLRLRAVHVCYDRVDPPDSVTLNHTQLVEELLKL